MNGAIEYQCAKPALAQVVAVASPAFIFRGAHGDRDKGRGPTIKCNYIYLYIYISWGPLLRSHYGPFHMFCSELPSYYTGAPQGGRKQEIYVTSTPRKYKGPKQWENYHCCKGCLATGPWCSATVGIPSCPVPAIYSAGLASVSLAAAAVY